MEKNILNIIKEPNIIKIELKDSSDEIINKAQCPIKCKDFYHQEEFDTIINFFNLYYQNCTITFLYDKNSIRTFMNIIRNIEKFPARVLSTGKKYSVEFIKDSKITITLTSHIITSYNIKTFFERQLSA